MSTQPVLLIFGAGANVGLSVAKKFAKEGYKIAGVARSSNEDLKKVAHKIIQADLATADVASIFKEVEQDLGIPNVVLYNAASLSTPPDPTNPFSLPASAFAKDLSVNVNAAYAAAAAAVTAFASSTPSHNKVFIFTGNMTTSMIIPEVFSLGVCKNAVNYIIETAANVYGKQGKGEKGFWYIGDERMADGKPTMNKIDGDAHAEFYWELAQKKEQGPVYATFVKGKGYQKFETAREVLGVKELMAHANK